MKPRKEIPVTNLSIENEPLVLRPTLSQLHAAIDRLKPSGPSFVVVSLPDGDFMQAGGGCGEFVVECRQWGEPFIHWMAGKGVPTSATHRVQMSRGGYEVQQHEVLSAHDVKALLGEFLLHRKRRDEYHWRNMTAYFFGEPCSEISKLDPPDTAKGG